MLGAPIVGDVRYGYRGGEPGKRRHKLLPAAWWEAFSPQTAHAALNPPNRRQRRQMAAAAARARRRERLRALGMLDEDEDDGDEQGSADDGAGSRRGQTLARRDAVEEEEDEEWLGDAEGLGREEGEEGGEAERATPVFLHSRKLVLLAPDADPVRVRAPLPRYMTDVMRALGWPVPPDSA